MDGDDNIAQVNAGTSAGSDQTRAGATPSQPEPIRREPTVLTMQDLLDLPRQILPEETYIHLRNAGRETALALYSLWKSLSSSARSSTGNKTRKHIDVE